MRIISKKAFYGCSSLKSISLPETLKEINNSAFEGCSSLHYPETLPGSLEKIGNSAFKGCTSLTKITIPGSVKTFGKKAFSGCTSLKGVTIQDGVKELNEGIFENCSSLISITIPDGINNIPVKAFNKCTKLSKVKIPDSVTNIGAYAFTECDNLKRLVVPKSVKTLGTDNTVEPHTNDNPVFDTGCTIICRPWSAAYTYVVFTNNVEYYYEDEENKELRFAYKDIDDDTVEITEYIGDGTTVAIPSTIYEKKVISIGKKAFYFCSSLESVTIPDGVTKIGDDAFANCFNLKSITIPNSVTSIGYRAFDSCSSLESITIPDSVTSIETCAFRACRSLKSVTIPSSITNYGDAIFINCDGLESVTLLEGMKKIPKQMFADCFSLKKVTIPNSVARIDNSAFSNCRGLTNITIPDGVRGIGRYAFFGCEKLANLTIPSSVEGIEECAFLDCKSLKSVTFSKTEFYYYIDDNAFGYYEDEDYNLVKDDDFVVKCYKDSLAEEYAKENGLKIEYLGVTHVKAKKATCTTAGNIEYWKYDNKYYTDKGLTKEITKSKTVIPMTGHQWGEPTWTWDGVKSATAKFVCENNSKHVETVDATITSKTTKATCEKDGKTVYTATVIFNDQTYTTTKTVPIDKLGHKYGEPTWTWDGVKAATAKFVCGNNSKHVETVTAKITSKTTKAATCTTDGKAVYTATVTFDGKTYTTTKTVPIDKLGHKWGKPTWTWDGVKSATAKFTCENNSKHVKTVTAKITSKTTAATCEKDGKTVYTATVILDGKTYTDTKTVVETKKLGHKWGTPTWTWNGVKSASAKFVCARDKSHVETVAAKITSKTTAATCEKDGKTVYTATVTFGGKTYTDTKTVTITKTGHKYGEPTWTWDGVKSATAKFTCENNSKHVKTVTAKITSKTTKATCEADGKTVYTATVTFGGKTYTDTKTVVETKKLGHKWGEPTWTWDGVKSASAKFVCARDKSHVKTVTAKITSKTTKATCEKDGKTVYTATVSFNGKTYTTTKTVTITKTGHKFSAWKTTGFDLKNNTSTQTRKCSVCGKTEKQTTKNAVSRFAGANRYDTAALISQGEYKNGTDTVIVATGLDFHDALVAVPLANAYNAPLLLTTDKQVTKQTEAELARLKAKKVIIVSTNGAVGSVVKTALAKYNPTMISGKNCFETASKVATALQKKAGKAPDTIFFATDSAFADALSASPVAAIKNAPIIYLKNTGSIDSATAAYLKSVKGKVKNAYIIGGDGVISDAMMKNVATALGLTVNKTVVRVAGANRYETCVAVNKKFKSVVSSDGICVAKGLDFPDALAGGVYAAKTRQALFLADGKKLQDVQGSYLKGKNASKITVFGGVGAVPDDLVKLIAQASV